MSERLGLWRFGLTKFPVAVLSMLALVNTAAALSLPSPSLPNFRDAAQLTAHCNRELRAAGVAVRALERRPVDAGWLAASDALNARLEDSSAPISLVSAVHPNKDVRDAAQACELRWQDFSSTLGLNEKLFHALLKAPAVDEIDRGFVKVSREGFEDAGMALSADFRPRAKVLNDSITALGLKFNQNIRDANIRVSFSEAELKGVPESVWRTAKRDADGRIVLGVDYPSYLPVLQGAEDAAARERMWRAKVNEGGDANMRLMAEIAGQRRELAALFGEPSYADFVLRRRMALTAKRTQGFLDQVKATVAEGEIREVAELRAAKAAHLAQPLEAVTLNRWDVPFYQERQKRERFKVDGNAFRPYFPPQESLRFVMHVAERMFGIRYLPVKLKTWHPEVQTYAVQDVASGRMLGSLYVDLYPREGKYNHAAVWSVRSSALPAQRARGAQPGRASTAALVVNFDRKGLSIDELETLLHEFGHALHTNLSQTRYASQAGTSVLRDFVEAPSQMLEDWVYDPAVIASLREVCPVCQAVPAELLTQARAAKDYGKGVQYARQHLYASFDLAMHGSEVREPGALWAAMEGATPLGHVPGSKFVAGFAHVAGGYAAGYYGYLWSLVLAMDLRTAFAADKLSPAVGARYRQAVLSQGSQRPPDELLRNFLGRESSPDAFFDYLRR